MTVLPPTLSRMACFEFIKARASFSGTNGGDCGITAGSPAFSGGSAVGSAESACGSAFGADSAISAASSWALSSAFPETFWAVASISGPSPLKSLRALNLLTHESCSLSRRASLASANRSATFAPLMPHSLASRNASDSRSLLPSAQSRIRSTISSSAWVSFLANRRAVIFKLPSTVKFGVVRPTSSCEGCEQDCVETSPDCHAPDCAKDWRNPDEEAYASSHRGA